MDIVTSKSYVNMIGIHVVIEYQSATIQRLLNEDYINELLEDQRAEFHRNRQFSILQSITCGDLNGKRYVLDGQHRVAVFKQLRDEHYPMHQCVPVVIYNTASMDEMIEYYRRINRNNPINPLEVTDMWFNYGKDLCTWLTKEFPRYCKVSNKGCNCPHIGMVDLAEYLKHKSVFERLTRSTEDLKVLKTAIVELNRFMCANQEMLARQGMSPEHVRRCEKCLTKCPESPCYLGMWRQYEWLEICIHMISTQTPVNMVNLSGFTRMREKIPRALRLKVWNKRNGEMMTGVCFVCDNDLCYENMECGHVIPFAGSGTIDISNLEPVCRTCNRDMGIMNLNEYKNLIKNK